MFAILIQTNLYTPAQNACNRYLGSVLHLIQMQTHTLFCGTCREIFINLESYMDHCTKFHFPIMLENLSMHTINKIRTNSLHINNSLPWKNQWRNIVDPYTHFNELMPELYSTLPPTNQVSNLNWPASSPYLDNLGQQWGSLPELSRQLALQQIRPTLVERCSTLKTT